MAHGILCQYCGWQETEHIHPDLILPTEKENKLTDREHSLSTCPGYSPEDHNLHRELDDEIKECEKEQEKYFIQKNIWREG